MGGGTSLGAGARNFIYVLLNECVLSPGEMCTTVWKPLN